MAAASLPAILGPNVRLTLVTAAGNLSITRHQEISVEEVPEKKDVNLAASWDKSQVIRRKICKLTLKGLQGLAQCYSDLPAPNTRITDINFELLDEDGVVIAGENAMPDLIRSGANPGGYVNFAVTEKKGGLVKLDDASDFEMVIESGVVNAV